MSGESQGLCSRRATAMFQGADPLKKTPESGLIWKRVSTQVVIDGVCKLESCPTLDKMTADFAIFLNAESSVSLNQIKLDETPQVQLCESLASRCRWMPWKTLSKLDDLQRRGKAGHDFQVFVVVVYTMFTCFIQWLWLTELISSEIRRNSKELGSETNAESFCIRCVNSMWSPTTQAMGPWVTK